MGLGFFFLRDPAVRSGAPANGSPGRLRLRRANAGAAE